MSQYLFRSLMILLFTCTLAALSACGEEEKTSQPATNTEKQVKKTATPDQAEQKDVSTEKKSDADTPKKNPEDIPCEEGEEKTAATPQTKPSSQESISAQAGAKTEESAPAAPVKKGTLLFFMNPAGGPCQMQDRILGEMGSKLTDVVDVVYISTDVFIDRMAFQKYGIRALPTMILLNQGKQEALRFPPGIQNPQTIMQGLEKL